MTESVEGLTLIRDTVRIDWDELGEGWDGDFDPDDPTDMELLRFSVYRLENGEWVEVEDSSYCTRTPVGTSEAIRQRLLEGLMDEFHDEVVAGHSVKKLGERMSWINPSWFNPSWSPEEES
jgi:hypothetical protein